jgi:hypothetical protein
VRLIFASLSFKEAELRRMNWQIQGHDANRSRPLSRVNWCGESSKCDFPVAARIDKNGAQTFACGAGLQVLNGCAAHFSRRLLALGPKTCSLFALITSRG